MQTGTILSTESVMEFTDAMLDDNMFLLTSRLTQDCLENLFSTIRFKGPWPSPLEFKLALKMITVAQFLTTRDNGNYQVDEAEYFAEFLEQDCCSTDTAEEKELDDLQIVSLSDDPALPSNEMAALYNIAGYCLHSLKK